MTILGPIHTVAIHAICCCLFKLKCVDAFTHCVNRIALKNEYDKENSFAFYVACFFFDREFGGGPFRANEECDLSVTKISLNTVVVSD